MQGCDTGSLHWTVILYLFSSITLLTDGGPDRVCTGNESSHPDGKCGSNLSNTMELVCRWYTDGVLTRKKKEDHKSARSQSKYMYILVGTFLHTFKRGSQRAPHF